MGEGGVRVTLRHAQGDHGELVEPSPLPFIPSHQGREVTLRRLLVATKPPSQPPCSSWHEGHHWPCLTENGE